MHPPPARVDPSLGQFVPAAKCKKLVQNMEELLCKTTEQSHLRDIKVIIRRTIRDILSKWYSTPWDFVLIPPGTSMIVKNQRKHVVISVQGQNSRISVIRGGGKDTVHVETTTMGHC